MTNEKEFLDSDSPTNDCTRREQVNDCLNYIDDELVYVRAALAANDIAKVRKHLAEIKGWTTALSDELSEK